MPSRGLADRLRFGEFCLDAANLRLWRGERVCRLTPKAFAVLDFLVARPGQLVSKDLLLSAVWPDVTVSEAALTVCIREVRRVLRDDARRPRFVETVHRRGFRFIGVVTVEGESAPPAHGVSAATAVQAIVGRDRELGRLADSFTRAQSGERRVVFVTGEAGIGKTSVIETFLAGLTGPDSPWVARGQCIEYLSEGEAYLPVLDAVGRLGRLPGGERVVRLLERYAPSWLAQMPGLRSPEEMRRLRHGIEGATRGRMLREMGDAVDAISADRALVLVIEDLHWSDHATLDLIGWLARRRDPARLFVLGTYRPVDAIVRSHPLRSMVPELVRHRLCEELPLEPLTESDVERYLSLRFPDGGLAPGLVRAIHGHTDGNPLFMVTVVDALVEGRWVTLVEGRWEARPGAEQAATAVPPSLAQLVEQQFDAVGPDHQEVLQAASVAGHEFSSAAAASGLEQPVEAVEARCAELARRRQFIEPRGSESWADGTVAARYRFLHALYRHVVYERLPAGRRTQLHRRIGLRLETAYAEGAGERAGELARHFLEGNDPEHALGYLKAAAENAQSRAAYREAIHLLTQALSMLARLPATIERARRELDIQTALGPPLMALRGFAAPEVERAYRRALDLCEEVGETEHRFPTLWGLWIGHLVRGRPAPARTLADRLLELGARDPTMTLLAQVAAGLTCYNLGELEAARVHLDQAVALYRPDEHRALALAAGQLNPAVTAHRYGAWTLWMLGYPDQALERGEVTLRLAEQLGHPPSLAAALIFEARLYQFLGDAERTQALAESTMKLATEQGFAQRLAASTILVGWARVATGDAAGLRAMLSGLEDFRATGAGDDIPYWLALLAEARLAAGQVAGASRDLDEALALIRADGPRVWEPEIHRLRGETRLASGVDGAGAEAAFLEALSAARRHRARSHELRAATALARLWAATGRTGEARACLAEVYGSFTEGPRSRDLIAARALLADLTLPSSRAVTRSRAARAAPPRGPGLER